MIGRSINGLVLILICGALIGCGRTPPPVVSPVLPKPSERCKVELQDEKSPEASRRTFYNELDEKTRVEIEYRDKSVGGESYDLTTGKVKERWRTYAGSKQVKERATFDSKGDAVSMVMYHEDGKPWKDMQRQKDGGYRLVQHWRTGILMSELLVRADGSAESLSYSDDGKWIEGRTVVHTSREIDSWDYYNAAGLVKSHSHWQRNGNQDVKYFRQDGTVSHRQWWRILRNFDVNADIRKERGWVLEKVEEYAADGKQLTRQLLLADGPEDVNPVREARIYNADGSYTVRQLASDNRVDSEETFSADGKSTGSTMYDDDNEKPLEEIDPKLFECFHVIGGVKFDNFD